LDLSGWLAERTDEELRYLGQALQGERVYPGCKAALLSAARLPTEWAEPLGEAEQAGWSAALLGAAVAAVLDARHGERRPPVQVVSTQPGVAESGFRSTPSVLRQMFRSAKREVVLAGYRLTSKELLKELWRRPSEALDVQLYLHLDPGLDVFGRKQDWPADVDGYPGRWWRRFLSDLWPEGAQPPRGWYSPLTLRPGEDGWRSMHIKSAVIDRRWWFVSSANFTDRALDRNFELGVAIDDESVAERVLRHFEGLARDGAFVALGGT